MHIKANAWLHDAKVPPPAPFLEPLHGHPYSIIRLPRLKQTWGLQLFCSLKATASVNSVKEGSDLKPERQRMSQCVLNKSKKNKQSRKLAQAFKQSASV